MTASVVPLPARILTRDVWAAKPATATTTIPLPSPELYVHHTAGAVDAGGNGRWADDMLGIQRFHQQDRGWRDFAYNLAVDQSGQVWEGCGVGIQGSHTKGRNRTSHAVVAFGNYDVDRPSDTLLEALTWTVAHGILAGWWKALTGAHRDAPFAKTSCCGAHLVAALPEVRREARALVDGIRPAAEAVTPRFDPPAVVAVVDTMDAPGGGVWGLMPDGGIYTLGSAPYLGSPWQPDVAAAWSGRRAARLEPHPHGEPGYTVVATTGERYVFPHAG